VQTLGATGRIYACSRIAAGTGLVLAPRLGARLLGDPGAGHVTRLLGARDLLLGLGALLAPSGTPAWRRATALCAAADAADALVSATRIRQEGGRALGVTLAALAGAATGGWVARSPR
jgi:hypothetical protein